MNTTIESPSPVAATRSFSQRLANALHDAGYIGVDESWSLLAIQERMDAVAEVIEEAGLKSADVADWLKAHVATVKIVGAEAIAWTSLHDNLYANDVAFMVKKGDHYSPGCATIEEAISKFEATYPTPEEKAKRNREQAAKLLAEAQALEMRGAA